MPSAKLGVDATARKRPAAQALSSTIGICWHQYLARRYGLDIESLEWEAGETPGPEQLAELDALLEAHPARWILWEAPPSAEAIELLAARGLESVNF